MLRKIKRGRWIIKLVRRADQLQQMEYRRRAAEGALLSRREEEQDENDRREECELESEGIAVLEHPETT